MGTMMNAPKRMPYRLVIHTGLRAGFVVATVWVDVPSPWIDRAEQDAARMAREHGEEIDIQSGVVFPSGRIAEWERVGIRVQPS